MNADPSFDFISAQEYDRLRDVHEPMSVRYLRGTALGPVRAEAFIDRVEGVKTYVSGYLSDVEGRTVEADGVFIKPAWARDGG